MNLDGVVAVLRVVHSDAGGNAVHVRTLLLVADLVNRVLKKYLELDFFFF